MRSLLSGFRRRSDPSPDPAADEGATADRLRAQGNELAEGGRLLEAIDVLTDASRMRPDATTESRLVRLRRAAFEHLDRSPKPVPASVVEPVALDDLPARTPAELSPSMLREGILRHGAVWVRGLVPQAAVARLRDAIDRSFDAYDAITAGHGSPDAVAWFDPLDHIKDPDFARHWRRQANAVLTADSPRGLFEFFRIVQDVGIGRLLTQFFGERPALAAEKCTMFRVSVREDPNMRVADWHQDGAFLGDGIRTINCWFALSRCGRDAPGMDVIPRRIDRVLPLGEEGCHFDWTVSPMTVARAFPGVRPWRPEFQEGDVLLFDELAVHRTAADEGMPNVRYAIESWFFAPSAYPIDRSTPLVV
jgi:hypothetical protein